MHGVKLLGDKLSKNAERAVSGECACFLARKQARLLTRMYDAALASHGLTSGQFSMLAVVAGSGDMTIQALADTMDMDHSTTSRGVAPLVKSGYLDARMDNEDGRKRILHLTQVGLQKLNAAAEAWAEVQAECSRLFTLGH